VVLFRQRELKVYLRASDKREVKQLTAVEAIKADSALEAARRQVQRPDTRTAFASQELALFRREYVAKLLREDGELRKGATDGTLDFLKDDHGDLLELAVEGAPRCVVWKRRAEDWA
jgi:hypothetical protein